MRFRAQSRSSRIAFAAAVSLMIAAPAVAQIEDNFYRGRQVSVVVGNPPGGTYDLYARLVAEHLRRHLPGQPTIIVQNMPGAGGLVSANWLYNQAPKDGSAIATFSNGAAFEPTFGNAAARFDPDQFGWLISLAKQYVVGFVKSEHPARTAEDLRKHKIIVPATGPGTSTVVFPTLFNAVLGTQFQIVRGYTGTGQTLLSIERGETEGLCCTDYTAVLLERPAWVKDRSIRFIIQAGVEKHPDLPDVPWVMDMARSAEERMVLELFLARQLIGRPFIAPPGLAPDRLKVLRAAMMSMAKDSEFKAAAEARGVEVDPVSSDEIEAMLKRVLGGPPSVAQRAREIMGSAK